MGTIGRAAIAAGVGVGIGAARRLAGRASGRRRREDPSRWLVVTVLRTPDELRRLGAASGASDGDAAAGPLALLGDDVEVRLGAAPGGKGTEIAARPLRDDRVGGNGSDTSDGDRRGELRKALRRVKSLLETGDVIEPDPPMSHPGPGGKVVARIAAHADEEGRL